MSGRDSALLFVEKSPRLPLTRGLRGVRRVGKLKHAQVAKCHGRNPARQLAPPADAPGPLRGPNDDSGGYDGQTTSTTAALVPLLVHLPERERGLALAQVVSVMICRIAQVISGRPP